MIEAVTGSLAGAPFVFQSDLPVLMSYAREHLAPLSASPSAAPVVRATLRWHNGQPPVNGARRGAALRRMERVDRDLYVADGELRWFRVDDLRDLHLTFRWGGDCLEVDGEFHYRLGNSTVSDTIRRLRQWRQRATLRQRRFPTLLAYLVYYPCWWWLEHMRDIHPIHAGGAVTPWGAILLAGASGVGKSTLSVGLALSDGARLLSDSFVLHSGLDVWPVREPVLLDDWSRSWLAAPAHEMLAMRRRYGLKRMGYQLPPERLAESGRAALLVFPRRSPDAYVRRIDADAARQRLSAGNLLINDLRRYWAFAAVMEQLAPSGLMALREAHLAKLAGGLPSFDFGVTPDMSCAEATASILQLIQDRPLRVAGKRP